MQDVSQHLFDLNSLRQQCSPTVFILMTFQQTQLYYCSTRSELPATLDGEAGANFDGRCGVAVPPTRK